MADDKEELTFGQVAIQQGFTTPERVRECLEIQEKIRSIGGKPRLLGDILYEKGYLTSDQINRIFQVQQAYQNQAKGILNIPGYDILAKIGQGGMGAVYKARQISMDRAVALKILPPRLARDRQFVDRFLNEARAVARLRHENIILGIDAGEANGLYFFVMEYVEGETVQAILRREGRLEEKRALKIALQIAAALQHAFDHRMVHRDIKPSNILITKDGTAKLCDLGLAKVQHRGDAGATQAGMAVGTPHYISPEQARGESEVDIRSDIYSLGASIYHMVTGEVPFTGPNAAVVMSKHVTTPPPAPKERNASLSGAVNDLILKCMSKHREHRYQTPSELVAEIKKGLEAAPPPPPRRAPEPARPAVPMATASLRRQSSQRSPVPGLVAVGLVAVAGVAVLLVLPSNKGTTPTPTVRPLPTGGNTGGAVNPAATDAEIQLRQLQGEVAQFFEKESRLKELPQVYRKLEAFVRTAAGTPAEGGASALLDEFKNRVNAKSDEAWRLVRESAEDPLRKGRLAEGLARLQEFPALLRAFRFDPEKPSESVLTRGGRECENEAASLRNRIKIAFLEHTKEIEQNLLKGDTRRAWAAGLATLPYTTDEHLRASDTDLRELPARRDETMGKILGAEVDALCKQGKFADAKARCEEVQKTDALPQGVRQQAASVAAGIARREADWKQDVKKFLWNAYLIEVNNVVPRALAARDLETARQALSTFLFSRAEERKESLWLPGLDYPGQVQPILASKAPSADAVAQVVMAAGRLVGAVNPDDVRDPARAALLDLRAVLLLDELFRQAEASARAHAETGEAINLTASQALDRSFFPGSRCQIVVEKGSDYFYVPAGKAAPRIGFSIRKGSAQLLLEDDLVTLVGKTYDPATKRWKMATADPVQRFRYGLLYYFGGRKEKQRQATSELEAARQGGVPALDRYLGTPGTGGPTSAPAPAAGGRAQELQEQIDLVRDLVRKATDKKTSWAFARKELNDLVLEFGNDPAFADKKADVDALQKQIEAGLKAR